MGNLSSMMVVMAERTGKKEIGLYLQNNNSAHMHHPFLYVS